MENREQGFEAKPDKFLEKPILLNTDMTLTEADIESAVPSDQVSHGTLMWKFKEGFTSYHLNPETRLLIVYPESGPLIFKLKPDSVLLQKYIEKYPPPKAVPEPWWIKASKRSSGEEQ